MSAKYYVYRVAAVALGALLGFLLHALLELAYIPLLVRQFDTYSLGFTWAEWFMVHQFLVVLLTLGGTAVGVAVGKRWWQMVYVERRWTGFRPSLKG